MGAKCPHTLTQKGVNMFDLKKYKVVKEFNGYRKGLVVSFNGKDAEKYKDFIVSAQAAAPVAVAPVAVETPAKKTTRRVVKKGRK